jgi:Bacterial Ig domain
MHSKFGRYSSSSSSSSSCSSSSFYDRCRPLLLSAITIVIIALQVLLQSPIPVHSQSLQSQVQENAAGLSSVDNFILPDGYIIESFLSNLSLPTSIAVDSGNGSIYVAESVKENNDQDHGNSTTNSSTVLSSSSSSTSFLSQQQPPQVRILKADTNATTTTTTIVRNALNWPVIDMVVDDSSGLLYAFHDHTTISRMNMTSGERQDIIATEAEEETAAPGSDRYEEQQDPLSFLINSSSQIALSGKEDNHEGADGDDYKQGGGNSDSQYQPTLLYIPCVNGDIDGSNNYCILSLPIDGNSATVDSNSINDNSSSFILQNMTSRPVGIAILNSSHTVASSSSLPPASMSEQHQSPYALASSQTSNSFGNNNNNYVELLIITSQPPRNSIDNNNNDNNEDATSSHRGSNFSDAATATAISPMSTIDHAKIFTSTPYQDSSNNLEDTINNNDSYSDDYNNTNYDDQQERATLPSLEGLVDYPYGQLGQVEVVFVPPVMTSSSSSFTNDTAEMNQAPSATHEYDEDTTSPSSPPPFGLNESTAFIVDFGNQHNSSGSDEEDLGNNTSSIGMIDYSLASPYSSDAFFGNSSALSAAPYLPKIIMLDVKTGNIAPFLTLKQPDSNFMPMDVAFDYKNNALYVLSISNSKEDINNNNNSGVIWKISYQGEEEAEASTTSSNDSSFGNGTDNYDNSTDDLAEPPSSNDTALADNSTTDSSSSYDEEEDDTDDESVDTDSSGDSDSSSNGDTGNNSDSNSSPSPSPPPADDAPIAEDDAATTNQDTPVVIDVLANDRNTDEDDDDDSLTIDSVEEESIQGGNVRIISGSSDSDDNSNGGNNANDKIEYTPAVGFFGSDEFTYTIVDGNGATDSAIVTVTVKEVVVLAPHPISYWLENEGGITEDLLEKAAEDHDNNEWSFNLGNFRVPVEFDVSDSQNDTKGILEAYDVVGSGGGKAGEQEEENNDNNNNDDDNTNAHDQLAAQLLAAKLNIENGVSTCESIATTIEYADTVLRNAQYSGPGSTENPTGESRDYAFELIEMLDRYNNSGCI